MRKKGKNKFVKDKRADVTGLMILYGQQKSGFKISSQYGHVPWNAYLYLEQDRLLKKGRTAVVQDGCLYVNQIV